MKRAILAVIATTIAAATLAEGADSWYAGDPRCVPPKDDGSYAAPYNATEHPGDYPAFQGADKPGWSCSYQRDDGVIVQYGNSLTPQQQWIAYWIAGSGSLE